MSPYLYDDLNPGESEFCDCGTTLLDGEEECPTCAGAPHDRGCCCDGCEVYWGMVARESARAAYRANRALVCSCGWTGAFIEHHSSLAYGPVAREGCEVTYRHPRGDRQRLVRKVWTGGEWRQRGGEAA